MMYKMSSQAVVVVVCRQIPKLLLSFSLDYASYELVKNVKKKQKQSWWPCWWVEMERLGGWR